MHSSNLSFKSVPFFIQLAIVALLKLDQLIFKALHDLAICNMHISQNDKIIEVLPNNKTFINGLSNS